jgi:CheY-like chemotaxis protein
MFAGGEVPTRCAFRRPGKRGKVVSNPACALSDLRFFVVVEGKVILVAEDDANDRFFINRALRDCCIGPRLLFVDNGEQAISYLQGVPPFDDREKFPLPAMLIVDVKMPRLNGFEVLTWVRAQPEWHCLPVIMLSSSALNTDVQHAYELTANTYLTKPATFSLLAKALEQLCQYWFVRSQLPHCGPEAVSMTQASPSLAPQI